jgi:hypothetical protein
MLVYGMAASRRGPEARMDSLRRLCFQLLWDLCACELHIESVTPVLVTSRQTSLYWLPNCHGFLRWMGHSFGIDRTTSLLRAVVNPDIVKKMGRCHSDVFLIHKNYSQTTLQYRICGL